MTLGVHTEKQLEIDFYWWVTVLKFTRVNLLYTLHTQHTTANGKIWVIYRRMNYNQAYNQLYLNNWTSVTSYACTLICYDYFGVIEVLIIPYGFFQHYISSVFISKFWASLPMDYLIVLTTDSYTIEFCAKRDFAKLQFDVTKPIKKENQILICSI